MEGGCERSPRSPALLRGTFNSPTVRSVCVWLRGVRRTPTDSRGDRRRRSAKGREIDPGGAAKGTDMVQLDPAAGFCCLAVALLRTELV